MSDVIQGNKYRIQAPIKRCTREALRTSAHNGKKGRRKEERKKNQRIKISTGIGFRRNPELDELSLLSAVRSDAKLVRLIWLDCLRTLRPGLGLGLIGANRAP